MKKFNSMCYSGLTLLDNQKIITKIRQGEKLQADSHGKVYDLHGNFVAVAYETPGLYKTRQEE